jgi:hypothetical protein
LFWASVQNRLKPKKKVFHHLPRLGSSKLEDDDDDYGLMAMIPMEVKEKLFRLKIENKKLKEQINQVSCIVLVRLKNCVV